MTQSSIIFKHQRSSANCASRLQFGAWSMVLSAVCTSLACHQSSQADPTAITVGYIDDGTPASAQALAGTTLGIEEAESAGRLLGQRIRLEVVNADDADDAVSAATQLLDAGALALVGGFDDETCEALSRVAQQRGVLFFNIGCRSDALRGAAHRTVFHIEGSDSAYLSSMSAMRASGGRAPVLWHESLQRYGAAQLNQRFLRRFARAPTAATWSGWMAAKVVWQVARDVGTGDVSRLVAHLESDSAIFDGHKGEPLLFDSATHQLVQPYYEPAASAVGAALTHAVTRVFPVEEAAALRAAAARNALLAVITNEDSRDVSIVDVAQRTVIATVPVHHRPRGVRVSPDGRWAYVATSDDSPTSASDADAIVAIDLRDGTVVSRHPAGSDPEQFDITPDGTLLVAANEDASTATITDLVTGRQLATLTVGIEPEGVAVSPDGRFAYVTAETSNTVSVIDLVARDVVANFLVDERPRAAAFAPDGKHAYVTNEISGTVSVVNVERHEVVGTVRLTAARAKPVGVTVSPDSRTVYVANGHGGTITAIDAATLREKATIPVGKRPWGVALDRTGRWLVSANGTSNSLSIIDTRTLQVVQTIAAGERPWGAALTR